MKNVKSILQFKKYIIENIEFNYNMNFDSENEVRVDFDMDKNYVKLNDKLFVVQLILEVFPKKQDQNENEFPFNLKVCMSGFFEYSGSDDVQKYLPNAVAIMYPYIRAIVTSVTANANVTPLILPTINTMNLFKDEDQKNVDACKDIDEQ